MARSVDIFGITDTVTLITPQTITSSAAQTGVDVSDLAGQALAVLELDGVGGTSPTFDVQIQDSDTLGGTYANFGTAFTQVTADGRQRLRVDLNGARAFIRANVTVTGTSPTAEVCLQVHGSRHRLPTG